MGRFCLPPARAAEKGSDKDETHRHRVLQGATDMLRSDVRVTGGITPLITVAHMGDGFRMKCEIHHGGNSLGSAANLHVTMAINNCDYYEMVPASGACLWTPASGANVRRYFLSALAHISQFPLASALVNPPARSISTLREP